MTSLGSLVLMRHAKSAYPSGVPDHDRPLNDRGIRDANAAGQWLAQALELSKFKILVSTANRAQQTWGLASQSMSVDHSSDQRIYEAAVSTLIDLVAFDISQGTDVLLVGHNPTFEDLALFLTEGNPSSGRSQIEMKYPTCGIAVLKVIDANWSNSSAVIEHFEVPRG